MDAPAPGTWQDFGQRVDLTASIRSILRNYPEGTSILKELCQNADDAKAQHLKFCLDMRTHGTGVHACVQQLHCTKRKLARNRQPYCVLLAWGDAHVHPIFAAVTCIIHASACRPVSQPCCDGCMVQHGMRQPQGR